MSAIFKNISGFIFICVLVFFQKNALIFIIPQIAETLFFVIKLTCLAEDSKTIA